MLARRLTNGRAGAAVEVNPAGTSASFAPVGAVSPFVRGRLMAMDATGGAAICYVVGMQQTIATLAPGKNSWVNHAAQSSCQDLAIDNRGDVVSISLSNNMITATRIVGGQVANDTFGANLMDEPALAVSPTGMAIVVARDTNFHVVGLENKNIAAGGTWSSLGRVDSNNVFDPGDSPEEPRPALDNNDNGIVIWHSNSMNDPKTAFALIRDGVPQTATFLSKEFLDSFPYPAIVAPGFPVAGFEQTDATNPAETDTTLFTFERGSASSPLTPFPGLAPTFLSTDVGLVGDGTGDLLLADNQGATPPGHLDAVLGDFTTPTIHPTLKPSQPRAGKAVTLNSGAADTFAQLTATEVTWKLPHGVKALHGTHGLEIRVRFAKPGRYKIKNTATDRNGNSTTATLTVKVKS